MSHERRGALQHDTDRRLRLQLRPKGTMAPHPRVDGNRQAGCGTGPTALTRGALLLAFVTAASRSLQPTNRSISTVRSARSTSTLLALAPPSLPPVPRSSEAPRPARRSPAGAAGTARMSFLARQPRAPGCERDARRAPRRQATNDPPGSAETTPRCGGTMAAAAPLEDQIRARRRETRAGRDRASALGRSSPEPQAQRFDTGP